MNNTLHAHVFIEHSSCDGTVQDSFVIRPTNNEDRYEFTAGMITSVVSMYSNGTMTIKNTPDSDETVIAWDDEHEEGYHHKEVIICEEDCPDKSFHRDQYAEIMGY